MNKSLENKKTIEVAGKTVTIKKLPVKDVVGLLSAVGKLPAELANFDKSSTDELIANIATIASVSVEKFSKIIVEAIKQPDITEEFILSECGLDDVFSMVYTILEVNNIGFILQTLKKIKALNQGQTQIG